MIYYHAPLAGHIRSQLNQHKSTERKNDRQSLSATAKIGTKFCREPEFKLITRVTDS